MLNIIDTDFDSFSIKDEDVCKLLEKFNVKPQSSIDRRYKQLKTFYVKNPDKQKFIESYIENSLIDTDFDSFSIIDEDVCKLLNTFNIKPHVSIDRRHIQLKTFFVNNPDMQNFIKSYIENSLAEIERVALKGE